MKGTTDLRFLQSSLRLAGSVVALLGEAPDAGQLPRQLLVFSDLLLEAPGGHEHYSRGTRTLQLHVKPFYNLGLVWADGDLFEG